MLYLGDHGLAFLEVPKTGSTAIRRMLEPYSVAPPGGGRWPRHMGVETFRRHWHAAGPGGARPLPETVCVVRDPVERAASWYRYRQRDKVAGRAVSSRGMTLAAFLEATLSDDPPDFAAIGSQAKFTAFAGGAPGVDHVFDYARLDLLVAFLSDRIGVALTLPPRKAPAPAEALPEGLLERFRGARAGEVALCALVSASGVWHRGVNPPR